MRCKYCAKEIEFDGLHWRHHHSYMYSGVRRPYKSRYCFPTEASMRTAEPKEKPETFNELYEKLNNE